MRKSLTLALTGLACSGAAFAQNASTTPTPVLTPPRAIAPGTNSPAAGGSLLYDNGKPDGVNGYSNATIGAFGARRTLLDDFTVPAGGWSVGCIEWNHLWASGASMIGTDAEFEFFDDNAGAPNTGSSQGVANVTAFTEAATGNVYFSRPEMLSTATFTPIALGAGTYWFEGTIVGAENNFWLTAPQQGNECWVNYSDLGGLVSGTSQFGVASDLAWRLYEGDAGDRITLYCDPSDGHPNNVAAISVSGNVLDGSDIDVCMTGGPAGQSGYLLVGTQNGIVSQPPGAKGDLCVVGGFIGRYAADIATLDANGGMCVNLRTNVQTAGCGVDYTVPNTSCAQQYKPGETWYFQFWHRQPMGAPSTFSQAACVTFK